MINLFNSFVLPCFSIGFILVGVYYVVRHPNIRENSANTKNFVSIAVGVMLSILALHLLPEVYESGSNLPHFVFLFSLIFFYILGWYSHNHEHDDEHSHHKESVSTFKFSSSFFGLGLHSIADGIVITSSYLLSPISGLVTTFAIALHHLPMFSGISARNGNVNLRLVTLVSIGASSLSLIGVLLVNIFATKDLSAVFASIAAASFLYIGGYDLTSYLREGSDFRIWKRLGYILLGFVVTFIAIQIGHLD
jgi:zinc and cadmium transporter